MSIKVDFSEIITLGKEFNDLAGSVLEENLAQGAHIAGAQIQSDARALVPVDTGALRISIENSANISTGDILQTVGPTQPYGKDIELGRPPGTYVSPQALARWAAKRGLNPYAVAKGIEKHGSPAQPYLFPSFEKNADRVVLIISQALQNAFNKVFK